MNNVIIYFFKREKSISEKNNSESAKEQKIMEEMNMENKGETGTQEEQQQGLSSGQQREAQGIH